MVTETIIKKGFLAETSVKVGYKQTAMGVIPEDWDVKRLDEVFSITAGGDLNKEFFSNIKDEKHPFPIYSNSLSDKGLYGYSSEYEYNENCVTITARGTLGVANPRDHKFNAIIRVLVLSPIKKLNCIFLSEYINNKVKFSIESTGVPQLTAPQLARYKIAFPDPKEQTAIATVLSDTDALIGHLEKLITKKKNIKRGAMQQLLTSKKKLPSFRGDWEVKKLGEIASVVGGGTPSTQIPSYWNGSVNWFTPTEIGLNKYTYGSLRKITNEGLKNSSAKMLPQGTILLTTRAGIGDLSILMNKGCTNQGFQSLIAESDVSDEFLYYLVSTLKNILIQNASGSTFLEISPNNIKQIEVKIPKLAEQIAIASILSDLDAEIESLEQKRDKYTMIKQGMMQQLLTGRIRIYATN